MLVSHIESIDSDRIHREILDQIKFDTRKHQLREKLAQQYGFRFQNLRIEATNRAPSASDYMKSMSFHTSYAIDDFMRFRDSEFIICCFRYLLKRDPDPSALNHYVNLLRNGRYDRVLILARVSLSKEARQRKIRVRGLLPRFFLHALYAIPLVGYLLQMIVIILTLPALMRKQDRELNVQVAELKSMFEHDQHNSPTQIANLMNKNNERLLDGLGKILEDIETTRAITKETTKLVSSKPDEQFK